MYQYFAINIIYSLLVFIYLYLLKTAPFRIRFRFVALGLASWLLPYDLINNYLSQGNTVVFSSAITEFNGSIKQAIVSQVKDETFLTLLNLIKVMTVVGFIVFIKDILTLKTKINKESLESSFYKRIKGIDIYKVKNNESVFSVGIINPKIYISEEQLNSSFVNSIIAHEIQHIKHNDPLWLLFITFVQRLLWWNPIVYLLANKGRELLELRCDQACNERDDDNKYQQDLAELLIQSHQNSNPLASNFFGKSKLNIYRIKQLSKEFTMNTKNKALIFSTAVIPFIIMLLVSTTSVSSNDSVKNDGNFDTMPINDNQAKIVLDAHLYFDAPNIAINSIDPNANLKTNFNSHKSFAASYIVNLDEQFSMESNEVLDFKIDILPTVFENDSLMFTTNIEFSLQNENILLTPALAIRRHDTGHIILDDGKGRYKFELFITVRQ